MQSQKIPRALLTLAVSDVSSWILRKFAFAGGPACHCLKRMGVPVTDCPGTRLSRRPMRLSYEGIL